MPEIQIRAINPDNERELRSVLALFQSAAEVLPTNIPTDRIAFWQRSIGKRFVSLGAFNGENLVAHLGVKRSTFDDFGTELILPALSTASIEDTRAVAAACLNVLERLSLRQGWNSLSCVAPLTLSDQSKEFARAIGLKESALLPANSEDLQAYLFRDFLHPKASKTHIFKTKAVVPTHMYPLLQSLQANLSLSDISFFEDALISDSDRPNIEVRKRYRLGQSAIQAYLLEALDADKQPRHSFLGKEQQFVAISCDNQADLALLPGLSSKNFICCGILPRFYGSAHILLAQAVKPLPATLGYVAETGLTIAQHIKKRRFATERINSDIANAVYPFAELDRPVDEVIGA